MLLVEPEGGLDVGEFKENSDERNRAKGIGEGAGRRAESERRFRSGYEEDESGKARIFASIPPPITPDDDAFNPY